MKNFSRFRVLSVFFVMTFLLAARSGTLVALAKGLKTEIQSTRIGASVSRLLDDKAAKPEMHEGKEPKVSNGKEAGRAEKITLFDDHKSNSNGSNNSASHDKDNSSGSSSNDGSAHSGSGDHGTDRGSSGSGHN